MKSSDRIVEVCRRALAKGPIGYSHDRAYYRAFVACGFDQDLAAIKTSCAVFVRAVLHWAGRRATRKGRIGQGVNGGWLEGLTFQHPAWVWNDGKSRPTPGCIFARDYTKATSGLYHVGVFIEQASPDKWHTAEGGGGDGTECRFSTTPKDLFGVDGLNRKFLGWWRPEFLSCGEDFTPGMPLHHNPSTADSVLFNFRDIGKTDAAFREGLVAMSKRLDTDSNAHGAVMQIECAFNPAAENPNGGAVGAIQFMPFVLKAFGTTPEAVKAMSLAEQLPLVERFYQPAKGVKDAGTLYMMTFLPAFAFHPDAYVLGEKDSEETLAGLSMHKIWLQNQGLDTNKDGRITVGEVKALARSVYARAKASGTIANPIIVTQRPTLQRGAGYSDGMGSLVKIVQKAVAAAVDGKFGPNTEAYVKYYQSKHKLTPDGIVGKLTWAKIDAGV